jgi:hypothetical protein
MGDVFKTLTAGFSRFVMAWIVPSTTTLALFCLFVYDSVAGTPIFLPIKELAREGKLEASVIFFFAAALLSLLFALGGIPLYRLLEGYTLPRSLSNRWRRAQLQRSARLRRAYERTPARFEHVKGQLKEELDLYPLNRFDIMPTRLGNGFRAMERYGLSQFGLDSQTFHYELNGVVPDRLRIDVEDSRAQVDFFLGFVWQLSLLSAVSLIAAAFGTSQSPIFVAITAAGLARLAYIAALKNMTDLRYAVQALVHLGRAPLANALGYHLPASLLGEQRLWRSWTGFVENRERAPLRERDGERIDPHGHMG